MMSTLQRVLGGEPVLGCLSTAWPLIVPVHACFLTCTVTLCVEMVRAS